MFNIGDQIRCIDATGHPGRLTLNMIYTVVDPKTYPPFATDPNFVPYYTKYVYFTDDKTGTTRCGGWRIDRFELVSTTHNSNDIDFFAITKEIAGG